MQGIRNKAGAPPQLASGGSGASCFSNQTYFRRAIGLAVVAGFLPAMWLPGAAAAQDQDKRWSVYGDAGVQFDDNVTTEDTDTTSNRADKAALFELGGTYRPAFGDAFGLEVGYEFSQSLYEDLGSFDLQSHMFLASAEHAAGPVDLGLNYLYGRTFLGGDDFLSLHSLTPTAGYAVLDNWYGSLRYGFLSKNFIQTENSPRDASNHAFTFDNFITFLGGTSYVALGYRLEFEDADGPEFDYRGHEFHARAIFAVPGQSWKRFSPTLAAGLRYAMKDFDNITPSIGTDREDQRWTISASFTAEIADPAFAKLEYENIAADSNLPTSDYNEQIVTVRLGFKF